MDLIHAELLATGARIAPLTTLDEIAAFFHAAAAVGQAAPARATAIAQRLGGAALPTPLPCSRASFQRCFRCSRLARICPSVPIATPVPCASMACSSLQNNYTTAPLLSAKGLVKQVRLFKRKCARAATPSTTSRTQPVACACIISVLVFCVLYSNRRAGTHRKFARELRIQNPEYRIQNTDRPSRPRDAQGSLESRIQNPESRIQMEPRPTWFS
jgi:hypothetical protein